MHSDATVSIVGLVILAVLAVALLWLAGLPGRIAARRQHRHAGVVRILGYMGFMAPFLWFIALFWAYLQDNRQEPQLAKVNNKPTPPPHRPEPARARWEDEPNPYRQVQPMAQNPYRDDR